MQKQQGKTANYHVSDKDFQKKLVRYIRGHLDFSQTTAYGKG